MNRYLWLLGLLWLSTCDLKCQEPQKGFYLSYDAMSKQQHFGNMMAQINQLVSTFSSNYTEPTTNTVYRVSNMNIGMFYNEHQQVENPVDRQVVNVSLGDIYVAFGAMYEIDKDNQVLKGWFRGKGLADQHHYFTKRGLIQGGSFVWDLVDLVNFTCSNTLAVDFANPDLDFNDTLILQNMVNDKYGSSQLKGAALENYNSFYKDTLKKHLNSEVIISTLNFNYTFGNLTQNYINAVKDFNLSDSDQKGLAIQFFLEIQNFTNNCTENALIFDEKEYGGIQELISMSTLSEAFRSFLTNGGFNVNLDQKWDVDTFQFYMGDLANFVPQANQFMADQPFFASCQWDEQSATSMGLRKHDIHDLYAEAEMICTIKHSNDELFRVMFDANFVVRVEAENTQLTFRVDTPQVFGAKFESIDPKFKVEDETLAKFMMAEVMKGLKGTKAMGTGWPVANRRFPATKFIEKYLVIFDAAQQ